MKKSSDDPNTSVAPLRTKRAFWGKDIVLNIGLKEGFIRIAVALLLPFLLMILPPAFIWPVAIAATYLFTTGLAHYCLLKYLMVNVILGRPVPNVCQLAKELDMPVDEI